MKIAFVGNHSVSYCSEVHYTKTLQSMGHEVLPLQEGKATGREILETAKQCDLLVWVHTHGWATPGEPAYEVLRECKRLGIKTLTFHLDLWLGLQRQKDLDNDPFYKEIQHFFTVDKLMADWFNQNTEVKGHFLPAGVFDQECELLDRPKTRDVIFVGSKNYHHEWGYRPKLINWLRETYGSRFTHVGGDGDTGTVRGKELNQIYASSKVVVGDTLCLGFDYPYYTSDRVFETMGRGGFIIHPYVVGMGDWFTDGEHLRFYRYNDFEGLKNLIDYYLEHDEEREKIRRQGHELVKNSHTYKQRWEKILEVIK